MSPFTKNLIDLISKFLVFTISHPPLCFIGLAAFQHCAYSMCQTSSTNQIHVFLYVCILYMISLAVK